jgi:ribosomal protein L29
MLSDYQWRKLKRAQIRRSYAELKHDQAHLRYDRLIGEFEEAFRAVHGRRPKMIERPQGKKRMINATQRLWAQLHNEAISYGLDD